MSKPIQYSKVVPELTSYGFVAIPLKGKRPFFSQWNKLTRTPDKLTVFDGYNIGILTGEASGITVLDVDKKDHGMKIWNSISSAYPEIITPMAYTASGGLHIYFRYNKKLRSFSRYDLRGKAIGWDLMNNDRLVVVPPSTITAKNKYKWKASPAKVDFAKMPKWLEEYLLSVRSYH